MFMVLGDLARGQQFPESPLPETSSGFRLGLGFWAGFWFAVYGIRVQPNLSEARNAAFVARADTEAQDN